MSRLLLLECAARLGPDAVDFGEEKRLVREAINRGRYGAAFTVEDAPSLQWGDLLFELDAFRPTLLHFSGHGYDDGTLRIRTPDGGSAPADSDGLCGLLAALDPQPALVVFNACWSAELAEQAAKSLPCTIGINGTVSDRAAIAFARYLYGMLASGRTIDYAHRMAVQAARTHGLGEWNRIPLFTEEDGHTLRNVVPASHFPSPSTTPRKPGTAAALARLRGSSDEITRAKGVLDALGLLQHWEDTDRNHD
ncbi:CHAT domain-containing protein [Nocardiopsis lucentensis]|uniref:CHAT domain-containing protein n=1 Tax=Nocardiopsis lucentensis TaxID=53441 RepID=UPI000684F256|nr:CHAT domain-containing protein [Nocardiopsis lucentensis]